MCALVQGSTLRLDLSESSPVSVSQRGSILSNILSYGHGWLIQQRPQTIVNMHICIFWKYKIPSLRCYAQMCFLPEFMRFRFIVSARKQIAISMSVCWIIFFSPFLHDLANGESTNTGSPTNRSICEDLSSDVSVRNIVSCYGLTTVHHRLSVYVPCLTSTHRISEWQDLRIIHVSLSDVIVVYEEKLVLFC